MYKYFYIIEIANLRRLIMNKKHRNIKLTNNDSKIEKEEYEFSIKDFVNITTQSALHTLLIIDEIINLIDK